jgi:hypothetical protein
MLSKMMRAKPYKKMVALVVVVALVGGAAVLVAQHMHGGADCNASLYSRTFDGITTVVDAAQGLVAEDKLEEAFVMLDEIDRQIATVRALCSGLVFRSQTDGLQAVIGPVHFGDGIYRARLITNGEISIQVFSADDNIPGDCDNAEPLFDLPAGQAIAPNGAEDVFNTKACLGLIEVNAAEPWVLAFEVVSGGEHHLEG